MHDSVRLGAFGCILRIRACLTASSLGCFSCRDQTEKSGTEIRDQKFEYPEKELKSWNILMKFGMNIP